jgi:hypothetical protein
MEHGHGANRFQTDGQDSLKANFKEQPNLYNNIDRQNVTGDNWAQ